MTEDISSASGEAPHETRFNSTTSMEEFEAELARRTKVPAPTMNELMKTDDATIRREADAVSKILKRFASAVVDSMDDSQGFDRFLRELDLKAISRDHSWRTIFYELRNLDGRFEQHKCVLVIKYLQYLSFRKKLLDYIHERKLGLVETNQHADLTIFPEPGDPARRDGAAQPIGEFACALGRVRHVRSPNDRLCTHYAVSPNVSSARARPSLSGRPERKDTRPQGRSKHVRASPLRATSLSTGISTTCLGPTLFWTGMGSISITDLSTRGTFVLELRLLAAIQKDFRHLRSTKSRTGCPSPRPKTQGIH